MYLQVGSTPGTWEAGDAQVYTDKFVKTFTRKLGVTAGEVSPCSRLMEDLQAGYIEIVDIADILERKYGIGIPDEAVEAWTDVGSVARTVEELAEESVYREAVARRPTIPQSA